MSTPMGEGTRRTPEGSRGNGDGCSPARGHIFVVIECTYLHVLKRADIVGVRTHAI